MNIISAWSNSLNFLMPAHIKSMVLLYAQTVRSTYELLWKHARTFLVLMGISGAINATAIFGFSFIGEYFKQYESLYSMYAPYFVVIGSMIAVLFALLALLLTFYVFICARASLHKKDALYVDEWRKNVLIPFVGARVGFSLFVMLFYLLLSFVFVVYRQQVVMIVATLLGSVGYIYYFFFLDLFYHFKNRYKNSYKATIISGLYAFRNACMFVFYNMPLFIIFGILYQLICLIDIRILSVLTVSFFGLLSPWGICVYAVIYTKLSHEQINLYGKNLVQ